MENKEDSLKTEADENQKNQKLTAAIEAVVAAQESIKVRYLIYKELKSERLKSNKEQKYPSPRKDKKKVFYSW